MTERQLRIMRRKLERPTQGTLQMWMNTIQFSCLRKKSPPMTSVWSTLRCLALNKRLVKSTDQEEVRTMLLINSVWPCLQETKFTVCTKPCLETASPWTSVMQLIACILATVLPKEIIIAALASWSLIAKSTAENHLCSLKTSNKSAMLAKSHPRNNKRWRPFPLKLG